MSLSLVDPFAAGPYEKWSMRKKTIEEAMADYQATGVMLLDAKDQLLDSVATPLEAAHYMAKEWHDTALVNYINNALSGSAAHKAWRDAMPPRTPPAIVKYQKEFPHYDASAVDAEISASGVSLPVGQILFHGGIWMGGANCDFTTTLPLSTTLCPQVALNEAVFRGKAYDAGELHLMVLRVASFATKAFVFRRNGTNFGHENEILFASGARLVARSKVLVNTNFPASKASANTAVQKKQIPVYVIEVDLF